MSQIFFNEVLEAAPVTGYPSAVQASMATVSPRGYTITIPNNFWYVGRVLRFTAMGAVDPQALQINFRLLMANETIVLWTAATFNTASPSNHSFPVPYIFRMAMTCRVVGNGSASGIIGVTDFISSCSSGLGVPLSSIQDVAQAKNLPVSAPTVQTSFNVNTAYDLVFQFQSSFADCQQFIIESLN